MASCNGTDFTLRALGFPQKADKKPTKNRQKTVLEMAVFQYASSAVHQYANPSPAGQSRKALLMGPV
jgi:hypothetical protein